MTAIVKRVVAPEGAYPVLIHQSVWEALRLRTDDGYRLVVDWGKPDAEGWYTPTATIDYTDRLNVIDPAPDFGSDD